MTWASLASRNPMGQQHYEVEIQRAVRAQAASDWSLRSITVTSARDDLPGARRTLAGPYHRAPLGVALALGGALYRTRRLVHRLDLRIPPSPGPEVLTIHDVAPLHYRDEGVLPRSALAGAKRARAVIAPSRYAAEELADVLQIDRVHAIAHGLSEGFLDPRPVHDSVLRALGVDGPFVLHAGGASQRKNLRSLASAWTEVAALEKDLSLVLCGPPDARRDRLFEDLPRVRRMGKLPADVVPGLMCRAEAVVVPSLYEGFGLPALEGMACGRPVVAARAASLPEVCGDAALLVEPDTAGLAEGMARAVGDSALRMRLMQAGPLRAAQFSWEHAAQEHLAVYAACL